LLTEREAVVVRERVAAPPRAPRGYSAGTGRGTTAGAARTAFDRGKGSRRSGGAVGGFEICVGDLRVENVASESPWRSAAARRWPWRLAFCRI